MPSDRAFRRNFVVIALLHVVFIAAVYLLGGWRSKPVEQQVMWIEDGSVGGGEPGVNEPSPAANIPPEPEQKPELLPPESQPEPPPAPKVEPPVVSEIVTPKATPEPVAPKPATPKPTTPKPAPKITPKPKPKATPKAPPKEESDATPKPKSSPVEKPKSTPGTPKPENATGTAGSKTPGTTGGNGPGAGNGKGPSKTGNGSGVSEFGWYFSMIHDRFHNRWDQPTSIAHGTQDFVTTLKIRIAKDGTILQREIVHPSGDTTMDQSVMTAAERVTQIDPLPAGLGTGDTFEINIAFKLDQGQ
jgi:TonB family protein